MHVRTRWDIHNDNQRALFSLRTPPPTAHPAATRKPIPYRTRIAQEFKAPLHQTTVVTIIDVGLGVAENKTYQPFPPLLPPLPRGSQSFSRPFSKTKTKPKPKTKTKKTRRAIHTSTDHNVKKKKKKTTRQNTTIFKTQRKRIPVSGQRSASRTTGGPSTPPGPETVPSQPLAH